VPRCKPRSLSLRNGTAVLLYPRVCPIRWKTVGVRTPESQTFGCCAHGNTFFSTKMPEHNLYPSVHPTLKEMRGSFRETGPNRNCAETLPPVSAGSGFGIFLGAPDVCCLSKHTGMDSLNTCVIPERRGHLTAESRLKKSQWCCIMPTVPSESRALRLTLFYPSWLP